MKRRCLLSAEDVQRAIRRMAHEVVETNRGADDLVIVAIRGGGVAVARALASSIERISGSKPVVEELDPGDFRDDRGAVRASVWRPGSSLEDRVVVLVDDVLSTGRTVRAALEGVLHAGRARRVVLAVLVDRGHRELPIRPDIVGRNVPTARDEYVEVAQDGVWLLAEESR